MDTKRLVFNLTLVAALVLGWQLMVSHLLKEHPNWATTQSTPQAISSTAGSSPTVASTNPSTMPAGVAGGPGSPGGLSAVGAPIAMSASIGSLDPAKYPMLLSVDPMGAGLNSVTLGQYYQTAAHLTHYVFEEPTVGLESDTRPFATRTITVDGHDVDVSGINWIQASSSSDSATYTATITDSGHPALALTKTYKLEPSNAPDGSQGYDISLNMGFRNLTVQPIKASATFNGPTPPVRENDRSEDRRYVSGHDVEGKWVESDSSGDSTTVSELKASKPPKDMVTVDPRPMLWLGACSSYFQAIYRPDYAGQPNAKGPRIMSAMLSGLDAGPQATSSETPTSLQISTTDFTIQPGQETPFNAHVFFGPKQRELLKNDYYASYPRSYEQNLVYTGGICGYITFSWLINVLYWILSFFHMIFQDWGLAIIGLVCLVRLLLHPITKRSQISMLEMGKKGPEIERLKKKFGDNKEELNKAMMEVMNPAQSLLGCLPMFLQTPIWIALWNALQSTFELRQSGFLRWQHLHLTWIADLSKPDALINLPSPINLYFFTVQSINILPLLVGCVSLIQQSLVPVPTNMTPEQEQQRKMQKWMLLLFPIMLYVGPSGLNLYILTSSTIGMIESKIIRDHIKQKEEAEKAGLIIVDPPVQNGKKNKKKDNDFKKAPVKKPGGLAGFMANMQATLEQARREAERRK